MENNLAPIARTFIFALALAAAVVFGCRCSAPKKTCDPLAGWSIDFKHPPNPEIVSDYKDYIQKLPSEERRVVDSYSISVFQDGTGQYAIKIEVPLNGTWIEHVLFYDKQSHRVRAVKYEDGRYRS